MRALGVSIAALTLGQSRVATTTLNLARNVTLHTWRMVSLQRGAAGAGDGGGGGGGDGDGVGDGVGDKDRDGRTAMWCRDAEGGDPRVVVPRARQGSLADHLSSLIMLGEDWYILGLRFEVDIEAGAARTQDSSEPKP